MEFPLVLKSCINGSFGTIHTYTDGHIYDAYFIYLDGNVNTELMADFKSRWGNRSFVCLTPIWQEALTTTYPELFCTRRSVMAYNSNCENINQLIEYTYHIPEGYRLNAIDEEVFKMNPLGFVSNYKSFEDFKSNGSGYVVWSNEKIVSLASSVLMFDNDVELNLYTFNEHRRKGLGIACSAAMLIDCIERQINIHWDAQNVASRSMAEKLGYEFHHAYNAYTFFEVKEP